MKLTTGQKVTVWLGVTAIVIAAIAAVANVSVVPEFRRWMGLDKGQSSQAHAGTLDLSPAQLLTEINHQAPYLQESYSKRFIGLPIRWETRFVKFRGDPTSDAVVGVMLEPKDEPRDAGIFCDVEVHQYARLLTAKRGTSILVEGEIEKVSLPFVISLKNAKLVFN